MNLRHLMLDRLAERAWANPLWQVRGAALQFEKIRLGGLSWIVAASVNK